MEGQVEHVVFNLYFLICVEPMKVFLLALLPRQTIEILSELKAKQI